jgi:putative ABC transport system permease protein
MFAYYLNLALRSLKRNKVLTCLMILAIAVGIGASMTTLTVMHVLSGDPLPGKSARIFYPQVDPFSNPDNDHGPLDVMDYHSAFDLWSAHRADRQALLASGSVKLKAPDSTLPPLMPEMLATTTDFFPMFKVPFRYGHPWSSDDDARRARVAVISSDLNNRLFGGADSVGRTVIVRGHAVRIIGVLAPWRPTPLFYQVAGGNFASGNTSGFYRKPEDLFLPFTTAQDIDTGNFDFFTCWGERKSRASLENEPCAWVRLWVELDSPAKVKSYRSFIAAYAAKQKALGRIANADDTRMMSLMQWLDYNHVVPQDVSLQTWLAFGFLLICLFNTVGLLLAKFLRRSSELGVRRALGASRGSVFMQCLVEAGMVGLVGGIGGWLLTLLGLWLVRLQPTPYAGLVHLDAAMFVLSFALAIVASLLAGLLPALRASRVAPAWQLKTL